MSINDFKSKLNDLARPNRFRVLGNILGQDISFLAKATSLPGATLGIMDVPYMGRMLKYAGDRTYDEWDITIFQANDGDVRARIKAWMNVALGSESNIGALAHQQYKEDLVVQQLDRADGIVEEVKLIGCVPSVLGPLELDWGTNDTPSEFTITLAYDYQED